MDDDLQLLEAELAGVQPVAPSPQLEARIARSLSSAGPNHGVAWWLGTAALPIAAAVAGFLVFRPSGMQTPATAVAKPALLKPVSAENVLYSATREDEVVVLDDGTPARRERLRYVDTIRWQNPQTHASLTWSVPREEVRVVPINYQ